MALQFLPCEGWRDHSTAPKGTQCYLPDFDLLEQISELVGEMPGTLKAG